MKSQRQGTISLSIGLVLLGTYLCFEQEPVKKQLEIQLNQISSSIQTVSSQNSADQNAGQLGDIFIPNEAESEDLPKVPSSWLHTFQGQLDDQSVEGELSYRWQVDLRVLPPDDSGMQTILVTESRWPEQGWSWFLNSPPPVQNTVLLRRNLEGELEPNLRCGDYAFQTIPIDQLLAGPSATHRMAAREETGNPHRVHYPWLGGNSTPFQFTCRRSPSLQSDLVVRCEDAIATPALEGVKRRMQLSVDTNRGIVTAFQVELAKRTRMQSKRVFGDLKLESSRHLTTNEVAVFSRDAEIWMDHLREVQRAVHQCAISLHGNSFGLHDKLLELQQDTAKIYGKLSHPTTRTGFRDTMSYFATACSRMRAGGENMAKFRARSNDFGSLNLDSLLGTTKGTAFERPVRVVAFVSSSSQSAADVVVDVRKIVEELRCQSVEVVVLSADYFEEDSEGLQAACGEDVIFARDTSLARQLGLFHSGLPWIAIVDADNQVQHLHPWLPVHDYRTVVRQAEQLIEIANYDLADTIRRVAGGLLCSTR